MQRRLKVTLIPKKAFEYIAGAPQGQKDNPLINILDKFSTGMTRIA